MNSEQSYNLGPLSQIPPGEGRVFQVAGQRLAVFHDRGGSVFASEPDCPHAGGPLADGLLGNGRVVCPLHERIFDLKSGDSVNSDCKVRVYSVELTEERDMLVSL